MSTTEDMRQRGWNLVTRVLSLQQTTASESIAAALNLTPATPIFELRRLRIVDDVPLSLQTTYLPVALCPTLEQDDLTGSLYRLLESRYGLRLWTARETLRAAARQTRKPRHWLSRPAAPYCTPNARPTPPTARRWSISKPSGAVIAMISR